MIHLFQNGRLNGKSFYSYRELRIKIKKEEKKNEKNKWSNHAIF